MAAAAALAVLGRRRITPVAALTTIASGSEGLALPAATEGLAPAETGMPATGSRLPASVAAAEGPVPFKLAAEAVALAGKRCRWPAEELARLHGRAARAVHACSRGSGACSRGGGAERRLRRRGASAAPTGVVLVRRAYTSSRSAALNRGVQAESTRRL